MIPYESLLTMTNTTKIRKDSYIYLGYISVNYGLMIEPTLSKGYWDISNISPLLDGMSEIYNNGDAIVFYR
jgi:uncharacterized membrane protein